MSAPKERRTISNKMAKNGQHTVEWGFFVDVAAAVEVCGYGMYK